MVVFSYMLQIMGNDRYYLVFVAVTVIGTEVRVNT